MPELWADFHPPEAEDPHGEDYFDLIAFLGAGWEALCDDLGISKIFDLTGIDREEHEYINNQVPLERRVPWSESMANWQDPQEGLDWSAAILSAQKTWPIPAAEHDFQLEQLETFERVLTRAKIAGLKFRLFVGT